MQIQSMPIFAVVAIVVICFKFSNFAYANTVSFIAVASLVGLLFALNLVTLLMQIQCSLTVSDVRLVVICFKFSNFAYANTVFISLAASSAWLLFALNLVTLLMQIQWTYFVTPESPVVICFKFSNFAYANTVLSKLS